MMSFSESIAPFVGVLGTGIAIYQWAVLNQAKKRRQELQYLLAGLNQISLQQNVARGSIRENGSDFNTRHISFQQCVRRQFSLRKLHSIIW